MIQDTIDIIHSICDTDQPYMYLYIIYKNNKNKTHQFMKAAILYKLYMEYLLSTDKHINDLKSQTLLSIKLSTTNQDTNYNRYTVHLEH